MKNRKNLVSGDVIEVLVSIQNGGILVDPPNVTIPWSFSGLVRWIIAPQSAAAFDPDQGVTFPPDSPFAPRPAGPEAWEMTVDNSNRASVGVFKYDVFLQDQGVRLLLDPTVQNDSPPTARRSPRRPRSGRAQHR